jgi:plastocyanin
MTRLAVLVCSLALGGALAGCGGDDNGGGGGNPYGGGSASSPATTSTPAAATSTPGSAASSEPVAVSLKDIAYHPANVTVHEGQKVRWTNDDSVAHTVTADSGASFDSGELKPGIKAFYETVMRNAGTVKYHCEIHPNMTGSIKIVP